MRPMIFFFAGRPTALLKYQIIFTAVSFASEPELAKNTLLIGPEDEWGARSISISASSICGAWERPVKPW